MRRRNRWVWFAPLGLVALGCASAGAVKAALNGDLAALRQSIGSEQHAGVVDRGRAKEIAEAVASREVYSGSGPGAVMRIRELRACAKPISGALEARAERQDEAAAEATLVLLATRRLKPADLASRYADADSGAWRAVAARASVAPEWFAKRRRFFADPDQRVRRAALEAAVEAPAALDEKPLLEAARLDPDARCRSLATHGVGALGGAGAVRALLDLWERADDDDRVNIVEAFGQKRAFAAGGRAALLRIAESGKGVAAVAAMGTLLRVDPSSAAQVTALFARTIREGTSDEQMLALQMTLLDGPVEKAVRDATRDTDTVVRIAALSRLLDVPSERQKALTSLREDAKDPSERGDAARGALARARDPSVAPALVKALRAPAWQVRQGAGLSLLSLGDYSHAATLLADEDANVRVAIACRILGT